jgi:DNA repair protein RadC
LSEREGQVRDRGRASGLGEALDDRPRERLARVGAAALSNRELIALLLGTGDRKRPVLELAEHLVSSGLRELAGRSVADLERERGVGRAKATRVLAALELGVRVAAEPTASTRAFRTPADAGRYLLPRYTGRPVEVFGVLVLDVRHRLKDEIVISTGCLTSSLVHPREVFREAVLGRAAAIVLFHNHPSGDPEPSAEDVALTRRLAAAGALLGIDVLDHIIIGAARWTSLKERGVL